MDRTYVANQKKTPVYERGLQIFRDEVCRNDRIKGRLRNILLDMVARERRSELVPRSMLKTITSMLVELGRDVYTRDFEQPFLSASSTFYQVESQEFIASLYLPCTFPVPSLYLPCTFPVPSTRSSRRSSSRATRRPTT